MKPWAISAVIFIIAGCTNAAPAETPAVAATDTVVPSLTAVSTTLPTVTPTATEFIIPTRRPTFTPSPTTPPPLPENLQERYILDLIGTNGNCDLPCWWGVTPGETHEIIWLNIITPLTKNLYEGYKWRYSLGFSLDEPSGRINFSVKAWVSSRIVQYFSINMNLIQFNSSDDPRLIKNDAFYVMEQYSLANMINKYGSPSRVWLGRNLSYYPFSGSFPYQLALFYDQFGILVFYGASYVDPNPQGNLEHCFDFSEVRHMRIYLAPPRDGLEMEEAVDAFHGPDTLNNYLESHTFSPLEKASGMTIEEFSEIYSNPDTDVCVESPVDIWD